MNVRHVCQVWSHILNGSEKVWRLRREREECEFCRAAPAAASAKRRIEGRLAFPSENEAAT